MLKVAHTGRVLHGLDTPTIVLVCAIALITWGLALALSARRT